MNDARILLVDDEPAVLDALCRQHRKRYALTPACGPEAALEALRTQGPFALVVSDYQMPGMNGIQFLSAARALAPEMIAIMLTGQADLAIAIDAVNQGRIFRFLTKPCAPELLSSCIDAGLEQGRLRAAERELLEQTLRGSIAVLVEVLALASPPAFGRATRIRAYVRHLVGALGLAGGWQYETAALLSQIGCVAVPEEILQRAIAGEPLPADQAAVIARHPQLAHELLRHIPRLARVAEIVRRQHGHQGDAQVEESVALGGRLLRAALDYDGHLARGQSSAQALHAMAASGNAYGAGVLEALASAEVVAETSVLRTLPLRQLRPGMILDEELRSTQDQLILGRGHELTPGSLERLRNYAGLKRLVRGEVRVRVAQGKVTGDLAA